MEILESKSYCLSIVCQIILLNLKELLIRENIACKRCVGTGGELICNLCGDTGSLSGFATFGGAEVPHASFSI